MPTGSLVQIVAQGSQDLFLTSIPEITFFKAVYYRHTNFAVNSVIIPLNGTSDFDKQITTILPKSGDLLYKLLLKIDLPYVNLINNDFIIDEAEVSCIQSKLNIAIEQSNNYKTFFKYNYLILNSLSLEIKTNGSNWTSIYSLITTKKCQYELIIANIDVSLNNVISQFYKSFPITDKNLYTGSLEKESLFLSKISTFIDNMKEYYTIEDQKLIIQIKNYEQGIQNLTSNAEYFSWIHKIGFYIIKRLSVYIGGNEITRYTGEYLDIFHSLNDKYFHEQNLNNMIGNVSYLTDYSNIQKNNYSLYIPLPLWFGSHSGNALPIISMIYHDIEIDIEFESLDKCCYFNGTSNITNNLHLGNVEFIADYIYLDKDEREKFAQFSHEYIVENIKEISARNININKTTMDIDLYNSTKELYWIINENERINTYKLNGLFYALNVIKITNISLPSSVDIGTTYYGPNIVKLSFTENLNANIFKENNKIIIKYSKYYDGVYTILKYNPLYLLINATYNEYPVYTNNDYGIIYNESSESSFNPIDSQNIVLRGLDRTPFIDSKYYNYIVPYQFYKKTPYDGVNVYSFALHPRDFQPSGSCNMGQINSKTLNILLNNNYYNYLSTNNLEYNIKLYACTTNVLRITNGITSLVFNA